MILLIDNYDSFTFNLFQYFEELGKKVVVKRNDEITITDIEAIQPEAIVISPGPGKPSAAGNCIAIIQYFYKKTPILGVCLGHQAIAEAFGANIIRAKEIKHGKQSFIKHKGTGMFEYLSQPLKVMRYHSLVIEKSTLPPFFETTAISMDDSEIMALKHSQYPVYGLQFHPESIGTHSGKTILNQFFKEIERGKINENDTKKVI
ncbi:anthranilate synthase/aminodeoxychorismate synthase-like glutamine amidotransferase [Bacillus pakistanensis]|uniref:Anthranilate synthase/aminodeoxychorismate synthase-like glutamine amidotransferase n=1 Tax=Rossellomorea pakistanensis TaxID=992288 RepID=A0ABS2N8K5_9BACI|nr:aminodeoxychorismate/anthranilate synthase component II [Bacillus pakistanensis]MBM7584168.1 anthranilate synthase/aminodeoxychorismate synthase-like glutamine amidotransferase [Bacillus pakistanensis]